MPSMLKLQVPRKLFTIRLRKLSRPLTSLLAFVPPKFIPTPSLVPFPLVQVIVPPFCPSPTLLQFPSTIPMTLPIIMTISWSPMVSDVNWSYTNELSVFILDSAIHADCVVTCSLTLQDGSKIPSRTLADTGCTRDNFMFESHFLAHPVLQQYIVHHPTNTIDLATHGSTATVSQYICIVIEIVHRGKPIRCKILVGIMKGLRYDLVLGLTVLASHYARSAAVPTLTTFSGINKLVLYDGSSPCSPRH